MRRFLLVLALLLITIPCFAQAPAKLVHNGEIDLGGTYQNSEKGGKVGSLTFDALAPLFGNFYIGPEAKFRYEDGQTGLAFGAVAEVNFGHGHLQPFALLDVARWQGSYEGVARSQASVGGGVKVGLDRAYLRLQAARQRLFTGGPAQDSTVLSAGVGFRL